MPYIQASLISSHEMRLALFSKQQYRVAGAGSFDALLSGVSAGSENKSNPFYGFAEGLVENITRALNPDFSANTARAPNPAFPFSAAFQSAFGARGPLPAFIAMMTAKLHLNAVQNQAFQDIAVKNKDVTKTPDNIRKIATELQQAGIG